MQLVAVALPTLKNFCKTPSATFTVSYSRCLPSSGRELVPWYSTHTRMGTVPDACSMRGTTPPCCCPLLLFLAAKLPS